MENVVPGALQRLSAADIIHIAGLVAASLGQEYCRTGAVHSTQRQGSSVSGIVDVPLSDSAPAEQPALDAISATQTTQEHFPVTIEIRSSTSWASTCSCNSKSALLCVHGAALLYQWLARPAAFVVAATAVLVKEGKGNVTSVANGPIMKDSMQEPVLPKPARTGGVHRPLATLRGSVPSEELPAILTQLSLSDLRAIAREYEVVTNGTTKQQLAAVIVEVLQQPDAVRRVAATLEKPQRQLLAALALAGGSMADEDLRGLFERFALGQPNQLQRTLLALQSKATLFRTSLQSAIPQQGGLNGSLSDVGWYVPVEVRAALRVSVPVTTFDVEQDEAKESTFQHSKPYSLLADLLLVARALDGYRLGPEDDWQEGASLTHPSDATSFSRSSGLHSADGSVPIPAPVDMSSASLIVALQANVSRSPAFLRFAVRLLRLAAIVYKDDSATPCLRMLPNAPRLLLATSRANVLRDLFELWLTQSSYAELSVLQEDGLRLRCRSTALNQPILRSGELDAENSEARQSIVALLGQVHPDQWISFPAFARFVYRLNPLFLQRRQRLYATPHWWLEHEEGRPLRPLHLNDWSRAELPYLSRLLRGPLYWWGLCDVVLSYDGRLLAFRLTPLVTWLLNNTPVEDEMSTQNHRLPVDMLEVMGGEDILVACSARAWPIIELLENFTEAAGVRRSRLCYHLTPKALGDALSRGQRPAYLLELLRYSVAHGDIQDGPLPQMLRQLEQWIASYGRVRIYTGVTLLETTDTVVMRELSATTSLDEQIVQTIHPTLHILKNAATERIVDDLKRRGQSPLLHDEEFYGPE